MLTIFQNKSRWLLVLLVTILIPVYFNLLQPGYFSMHDDVSIMRLFEMKKCFQDGQLPCRWTSDFGAGYGHPLYNFHPVFPYYLGMIFRLSGLDLITTAKILFLLSLVLPGVFMYLLVKEFFGKMAGVVGAVLYVYSPYHAVDVYVRGALTESWGMTFFPLIWWGLYKLIKDGGFRYWLVSVLSLSGLFLSHNIMMLLFTPLTFLWGIYWMAIFKKWSGRAVTAFLLAFGLSSFFVLPALLETSLLKVEQVGGYYSYHDHFVNFNQLLWNRHWGYGPSIAGFDDDLSFQIGWPHWWLGVLAIVVLVVLFRKNTQARSVSAGLFAAVVTILAALMATGWSSIIWEKWPLLDFVQFPWRWLGIVIFANSLLVGLLLTVLGQRIRLAVAVAIIVLAIVLNVGFFHPNKFYPTLTDQEMLSGGNWSRQAMSTLGDYVPKDVTNRPASLAPNSAWVESGQGLVNNYVLKSNRFSFEANIISPEAQVRVPIFDFPKWRILVDGRSVDFSHDNSYGLISLMIPIGVHSVEGHFMDTPLRGVANTISLVSLMTLLGAVVYLSGRLVFLGRYKV